MAIASPDDLRALGVAVRADFRHYVERSLVNLRIIAALCLDTLLGWPAADPILDLVITVYLLDNGDRLALDS